MNRLLCIMIGLTAIGAILPVTNCESTSESTLESTTVAQSNDESTLSDTSINATMNPKSIETDTGHSSIDKTTAAMIQQKDLDETVEPVTEEGPTKTPTAAPTMHGGSSATTPQSIVIELALAAISVVVALYFI